MNRMAIHNIVHCLTGLLSGIDYERNCDYVQTLSGINSNVRIYFASFDDMQAYYSSKELSPLDSDSVQCTDKGYWYLVK